MAAVKDKASTGRDHLRYMLSSWFELSKDAETETGPNSASMVGQAKPETQEQVHSFVLEVLFCAWKLHALGPGVRGSRNRAGSNPGWGRHGVTPPVLSSQEGAAKNSGSGGDSFVPRWAHLTGARQARQLGSRYFRVQTTPPDDVRFGRRSSSPAAASPPPQLLPPWPRAPPPPLMACSAPRRVQRSSRRARNHRKNKRPNVCDAGKKRAHRPSSSSAGCSGSHGPSPELHRRALSRQRCQSAAADNRQHMAGREQDTAGRKAFWGDGWGGWVDPHRPVSEKHEDISGRKEFLGYGWQGEETRHRPVTECGRGERREKRTNFSVILCGGEGLGSRRARRERPTKSVEVLRRVTACLERYSRLETRQRRALTLCRAAHLAKATSKPSSEVVAIAATKVAKPGGGVVGCRSGRPNLARDANGVKGPGRGVNGKEGPGRDANCNKAGGGVNSSSEERGRDVNGSNILLIDRYVKGNEELGRYANGNKELRRGANGTFAGLPGRKNTEGGAGGADVVGSVRSEMFGRGPYLGKGSEREDRWT